MLLVTIVYFFALILLSAATGPSAAPHDVPPPMSSSLQDSKHRDIQRAPDDVATKRPPKRLQRSQTTIRQKGQLPRMSSLPSRTQILQAEANVKVKKKDARDQALNEFMKHRVGPMQMAVGRFNSAHARYQELKRVNMPVINCLSRPWRHSGHHPDILSPARKEYLLRPTRRPNQHMQGNMILYREVRTAWEEQGRLGPDAHKKYDELKHLSNAGFGSLDFHHKYLGTPPAKVAHESDF